MSGRHVAIQIAVLLPTNTKAHQVQRADHTGQHVVKVMSDATRELTHRVHLHGLTELLFGSGALLALLRQLFQCLFQRTGACLYLVLEIIVETAQHLFVLLFSVYVDDHQSGAFDLPLAVIQRHGIDARPQLGPFVWVVAEIRSFHRFSAQRTGAGEPIARYQLTLAVQPHPPFGMLSVGRWDSAIGHIPLVGGIAEYGGPVHVDQAYANRKMFDQPL